MADTSSDKSQLEAEDELEAVAVAVEVAVLAVIARRLGKIKDGTTHTALMAAMNDDMAEIEQIIRKGNQAIQETAQSIMQRMASSNDQWAKEYYEAMNVEQLLFRDNAALSQALKNGTKGALGDISATCRTSVLGLYDGKRVAPIADTYQKIVNEAASAMAIGESTYQQAVIKATRTLSDAGLKVMYESGETRELYAAVRTNVMDAYRTTMVEMRNIQGAEFGADGVEVSAHEPCAPDHEEWQGRRFSFKTFKGIQSGLSRQLVDGANCHHTTWPVVMGVGKEQYSKAQREAMKRRSNEQVTFTGLSGQELTMSRYEATQYQRGLESQIRKANTNAELLKQTGYDKYAAIAKSKANERAAYYRNMSASVGLGTRMERTKAFIMI